MPASRVDLPSVWLLAVRKRALDDLGVPDALRGDVEALEERYPILRTFFEELADEARIDRGVPIQQVSRPGVFRIRAGDRRAAVWYDAEHGVVWLCRVLAISDFPDEPALHREFGRLARSPDGRSSVAALLPGPVERREAGGEQHLEAMIAALIVARDHAYKKPQVWQPAEMRTPAGILVHVGRAYVDRQVLDASGELVTHFLIVLDEWPAHLTRPASWRERVIASCFADAEPVKPAYHGLPQGTRLLRGEIPLVQERLEPRRES